MKGTGMKYLLFIVSLVMVLIAAGCTNSENKNTVIIPTQITKVPSTITSGTQTVVVGNSVSKEVAVYFFYGEECPPCHNVMPFIQNLSAKYPEVDIRMLETWHNETNLAFSDSLNAKLGVQNSGVPEVIIGNTALIGDKDIPARLETLILEQLKTQ